MSKKKDRQKGKEEVEKEQIKKEIEEEIEELKNKPPQETEEVLKEIEVLKQQLEEAEIRNAQLEDRLLRLAAEFDNYKKRTQKEMSAIIKNANENLILQLIDTLDNFNRALEAAKSSADFDSFHKGVELINIHLQEILKKEGLTEIESVGKPFDPHLHEAVMQTETDNSDEGMIIDEISKGYKLNDKIIKHSKVVVSKKKSKILQSEKEKMEIEDPEENPENSTLNQK